MRWLDTLLGTNREPATSLPPVAYVPGITFRWREHAPDRLPSEIVLTKRDGTDVVYVPKPERTGQPSAWRKVNEEWPHA